MTDKKIKDQERVLPVTDTDWTIHSLNIQGTYFERWCQETIKSSKWQVISTNYPVEFPPHNGPFVGEQSTLDIFAQLKKQTITLTLLVECKKNNPEFVDWVFFPHSKPDRPEHFSGSIVINEKSDDTHYSWHAGLVLSPMRSLKWVTTSDAWETRGNYLKYKKENDKTRVSNAAINGAAHQIALATKAVVQEELSNSSMLSKRQHNIDMPYTHQIFIPTIVTTAKLYVCDFNALDIDGKRGEVNFKKAKLKEQPYLLYEYPLPAHFRSEPSEKVQVIQSGNRDFGTRMDILVVNSEHLSDFLGELESSNA